MLPAREGGLWIATSGGLHLVDNGHLRRWTRSDGLPSDSLLSLAYDAAGALWIGSYGAGIGRLVEAIQKQSPEQKRLPIARCAPCCRARTAVSGSAPMWGWRAGRTAR